MAAPVSPDDKMRVRKTFEEAAGPVRIPPSTIVLKDTLDITFEQCFFLPLQDDRVNAKELMELLNSGFMTPFIFYVRMRIFHEESLGER